MAIYQQDDIGAEEKSDNTPVTKADLASNEVLMAGLRKLARQYAPNAMRPLSGGLMTAASA